MIKNIIIVFQFFLLFSLMTQKPENVDILVKDLATSKDMVVDGTEYIKKTFNKEFSAVEEKIEDFEQNKAAESPVEQIDVETWFKEKDEK